ncbi:MAG: alpha-L-fucosidase [Clostridia bacterium]|nr:alpha-L-fucosidase [Clostridia bacterium]
MRPFKRAIHIDFHTMPGIYNFNENWDAREQVKILKDAHVKYICAFCKCNEGFAYYPTKIGVPYPGMKGDMFGELLEECHKNGIGVSAYFNVGYDHEMAIKHRDWRVLNKDLAKDDPNGILDYFIDMCYYHGGYREYTVAMIKEVLDKYDVDGVFLDCMSLNACYGNECVEEMRKLGRDPKNPDDALKTALEAQVDFCREVHELVGDDKYLYFNGLSLLVPAQEHFSHVEIEGLPGGQGYDYFQPQMAYSRGLQDKVIYMTGRFQKSWGDFGGFKGRASLENDIWDALSNAAEVSVGDHQHPAYGLNKHVYKTIGEIYEKVEAYEPWTDGAKYVSEIGVLTPLVGEMKSPQQGASRMLGELKYDYDIINENMDFSKYKLLILPDDILITPALEKKLKKHLDAGRGIISSGFSGLKEDKSGFALKEWDFGFDGVDSSNASYFKMTDTADETLGDMMWSMYSHGILMKPSKNAEVTAEYVKPYFNRHHDGERGFWYVPPEKTDGHAAAARKGQIYHICFRIFDAYYTGAMAAHKRLVQQMIESLMPDPLFKTEGIPSTARVTVTENEKNIMLHIKATFPEVRGEVDIIEEHQSLPAGARVMLRGKFNKAYIVPAMESLPVMAQEGYTEIVLPQVDGYMMIAVDKV